MGLLFSALGLVGFSLLFRSFGVSPWDTAKFVLGLALGVYCPGRALLALLRVNISPLETTSLALALGMTSSTLVYRIAASLGVLWLFWGWLGACFLGFLAVLARGRPGDKNRRFRVTRTGIGFAAMAAAVLLFLTVDNYRNGVTLSNGSIRLHMHYYDGFTRNNLVRELSHSVPPQMSFAAGFPISYHYDMNLFASFFYKYLGLDVLDLLHRFTITFYFAVFLLSAFIFIRRWSGSEGTALLGTALILFGSGGLSYVFSLVSKYPGYWGQPFFSFYYIDLVSINPILPALAVLLSGLFCLEEYFRCRKQAWLWLAAFFLAVITGYKMTLALPLLAALAGAALFAFLRRGEKTLFSVFLTTGLLTLPFLATAFLLNRGGTRFLAKIRFSDWITFSLHCLKIKPLTGAWEDFLSFSHLTPLHLALVLVVLAMFLAGSLGLTLLALPSLVKETVAVRKDGLMNALLGFFFFACLGFFFWMTPYLGERGRSWIVVDAFKVSALVLLLYGARWLIHLLRGKARAVKAAAVSAVLLLSIPNTVNFIWIKWKRPGTIIVDKAFLETCRFLNKRTKPESIILHSRQVRLICYFADRRVVLDDSVFSYLDYHLDPAQQAERRGDIDGFFAGPADNGWVLDKYRVAYVWVKRRVDSFLWKDILPEHLYCRNRAPGEEAGGRLRLDVVFRNSRYALYQVQRLEY